MKTTQITLPELALVAGTRGMLGAGIGLLLSDRLSDPQRRAVGWTLFITGALSTIPLALEVLSRAGVASSEPHPRERLPQGTWPEPARRFAERHPID